MLAIDALRSGREKGSDSLTVQLSHGDHLAISGASGCGKTSLLKVIAGLMPAQSGSITFSGKPLTPESLQTWRQTIYYCPQQAILGEGHRVVTLKEALLLPWDIRATQQPLPNDERLQSVLSQLAIQTPMTQPVAGLSGGEAYRVMIARGLLLQRKTWLLDEPTAALDKVTSAVVVKALAQESAVMISVSHDVDWIETASHHYHLSV